MANTGSFGDGVGEEIEACSSGRVNKIDRGFAEDVREPSTAALSPHQ